MDNIFNRNVDCNCLQLFDDRDRYIGILIKKNITEHSSPCCGGNSCCCEFKNLVPQIQQYYPENKCCCSGKMIIPQLLPNPCCGV